MKQKKHKAIVKEQKKLAKKDLTDQIKAALSTAVANFAGNSKKIDKIVAKTTKQLVKKLSKEKITLPIHIESPVIAEKIEENATEATKTKKSTKVKI